MSTLDVLPTSAELAAHGETLQSVDGRLTYLSTAWKYSNNKSDKKTCLKKINHWLDVRLEVMKINASSTGNKTA